MRTRGNQQTARAMNRRLILNLLRREGALARAELALRSGLSPAAVTFVMADLLDEGLVHEGETVKGPGGRRPIPVSIDYSARLTVGMKLTTRGLEAVLADLSTAPLRRLFQPIPDTRPETVVAHAARVVRTLVPQAALRRAKLVGVGLALPGAQDHVRGLRVPRFGWQDVPLAAMLAQEVDVPVWVDNDVNAFALAQHLFGAGQRHDNLLALGIGSGIGAAFLTEGALHRGARGGAGEIGHITIDPQGPVCECGRRGCAQVYWSEPAITAQFPGDLGAALAQGDASAMALIDRCAEGLGRMVAHLLAVTDPDIVIIGGEAVRFGEPLRRGIEATAHALAYDAKVPVIFDWQEDAWPRGAAALAAQQFFDFETMGGAEAL